MKKRVLSFEDLEVYKKLCQLHLEINDISFDFPEFELSEMGSRLRKSSNSAPASIAEAYSNKNMRYYINGIDKALGEIRETRHHLTIALKKRYIDESKHSDLLSRYEECVRLLRVLQKTINNRHSRQNIFTKNQFADNHYQ